MYSFSAQTDPPPQKKISLVIGSQCLIVVQILKPQVIEKEEILTLPTNKDNYLVKFTYT